MSTNRISRPITAALLCFIGAQLFGADLTPAQRFEALAGEYDLAQAAFAVAIKTAKSSAERDKVRASKRPDNAAFATRFLKLADAHPKDPAAVDALVWAANHGDDDNAHKALDRLFADHVKSDKIGAVCEPLADRISELTEQRLRKLIAENPHPAVKAEAAFALGFFCKNKADLRAELILKLAGSEKNLAADDRKDYETIVSTCDSAKLADEAAKWFRHVAADAATNPELSRRAQEQVHESTHFTVGREAMEIEGVDVDGRKLKLSDFRGKVVVLDFWGDW